ncbi:DUF3168 domain-containing protein [Paracoccus aerodenitrificans]|uniref:DUF3168 domain-containing protein n=1 Tax=Paracoccus aerodenitrificans TaxID=3017781 RepID=UPI0022F12879|nr:DUF3168 domain-containing protein [Paracoccus aerodenitrificans]WBU65340.1 DUF3168 domain-containing protein [Paracoccus aerodenitrificans]
MSYRASAALQGAVYQCLLADPAVAEQVGDAVYDAVPIDPPSGVYISLGPERVVGLPDSGGGAARHDFVVSVLAGTDQAAGFAAVKRAADAVSAALETTELTTQTGHVAGLWFLNARAKRVENSAERRVDLTFRALMDLA